MPNLNVCTGQAFGVGSLGELEPANVRSVAWPFSSSPTTAAAQMAAANGLRYDQVTVRPGGGLWVPQVGPKVADVKQTGSPGASVTSSASVTAATSNIPFANTSTVQSLAVLAELTFTVAVGTTGANWVELWAGATLSVGTSQIVYGPQVGDSAPSAFTWHDAYTDSLAFSVAPSSTVNIVPQLAVKNVGGPTATFVSWVLHVCSITALIDPTTEG